MTDRSNSKSELDERRDESGGISWTTFKRSKNGYFLCRNCGFEIIHVTKIDNSWREHSIKALDQGNTKLGNKVKGFSKVAIYLNCKKCEKAVGYTSELEERDTDNVTSKFLFETEKLVYKTDSLSCKKCRCVVDKGDTSSTSTFKWEYITYEIILKPIQNENGKFYDVKTCFEVYHQYIERRCFDNTNLYCAQCNALIGVKIVSTEENEEPFVGYILKNLNHDDAFEEITDRGAEIQLGNELKGQVSNVQLQPNKTYEKDTSGPTKPFSPESESNPSGLNELKSPGYLSCETDSSSDETSCDLETYSMDRNPRGLCLIINNVNFKNKYRAGSDIDQAKLELVFDKHLKFKVVTEKDQTDEQMYKLLEKYSDDKYHTNVDCFVCCILSHGHENVVSGVNNRPVNLTTITSYFQALRCAALAGKPKLFFFQACQGSRDMEGAIERDNSSDTTTETRNVETIPNEADFLLSSATSYGFVSYRDIKKGSVYIQTLCNLLQSSSKRFDLLSILTMLNNEVAKKEFKHGYKQMPSFISQLRKQLFLK